MDKEFIMSLGVTDESLATQIVKEFDKQISNEKKDLLKDYVPFERFNKVNNEKKDFMEKLNNSDEDKLRGEITALEEKLKDSQGSLVKLKLDNKISEYVDTLDSKPHNLADLNLDLTDITEDNLVEKLEPQFKSIMESKPYLFISQEEKVEKSQVGNDFISNINKTEQPKADVLDLGKIASEEASKLRRY